jgi:hypothetical protein
MDLRTTLHQAGAAALQRLLEYCEPEEDDRQLPCSCRHTARYLGLRDKTLVTVVGETRLRRPYYLCSHCGNGQFPVDRQLDVEDTSKSPGVRRILATVGQQMPFKQGSGHIELLADLEINAKEIERVAEAVGEDIAARQNADIQQAIQLELPVIVAEPILIEYVLMDGTGVPVVKTETAGRIGKTEGQPAYTREAKLGCVFTQTEWDKEGYPVRDSDSTTYVAAIETATEFGKRIYLEAVQRGWNRARKQVVIGDGAEWIWNIAQEHFSGATQIVDLFHARQHLWDLARKLHPNQEAQQKRWVMRQQDKLDNGQIEKLVRSLKATAVSTSELAVAVQTEADYFAKNAERMRYPEFRRQHLFIGSGVVEAGCKTVIGSRLKQSGMFWTVRGANAILALRCCLLNGRFEDYWASRTA